MSIFADVLFIISWLIASSFTKSSITDMDLDPEEDMDDFYQGTYEVGLQE